MLTYKEIPIGLYADFSEETPQVKNNWNDTQNTER